MKYQRTHYEIYMYNYYPHYLIFIGLSRFSLIMFKSVQNINSQQELFDTSTMDIYYRQVKLLPTVVRETPTKYYGMFVYLHFLVE